MTIDWQHEKRLPHPVRAVLAALRFDRPDVAGLRQLNATEWKCALDFCDRSQLTLVLGRVAGDAMPESVRSRIHGNLVRNRERLARVLEAYDEISAALQDIEFAVLKGFTLSGLETRVQYDIDLVLTHGDALRAKAALAAIGYESLAAMEDFPTDHLPTMVRKTGWEWRGDFFDPEIPVMVDLHFRFWDERTERLPAPGVDAFWTRRTKMALGGRSVPCLHPVDALGYFCLHLLRHLLRGSPRILHVYELAHFLESRQDDAEFWEEWGTLHSEPLRKLEFICFELANAWFGCRIAPAALPEDVRLWFERHSASPVENLFHPNKSELWLHLALLESWRDRFAVLGRRLLPTRLPGPVDAVCLPDSMLTRRIRIRKTLRYVAYLATRVVHHLRALPPFVCDGAAWWWRTNTLGKGFWTLLGAASLFDCGMYVFVVLYNLYLLERGFNAEALGWISSASTAGCIAGTLPAGLLARRLGLRGTVMLAFGATALLSVLRATIPGVMPLVLLSFVGGIAFSLWAVSMAPAIAGLTSEPHRARAFSVFFSISIALGILGGWVAGHLPGWLAQLKPGATSLELKQAALLAACFVVGAAQLPAARLRLQPAAPRARTVYPRGRFIAIFLVSFAIWNLATGAFNPFFNVYFSTEHHASTETIGTIFSVAQFVQIFTLLAAPIVLRRLGLANGVAAMMAATGIGLACLASAHTGIAAVVSYAGYMAVQWMSEPGINTLLMNRVRPEERGGASAFYYLVAFSAQAIAAAVAGASISHAGFQPLLFAVSIIALLAALAFRQLASVPASLHRTSPDPQSFPEPVA